MERWNARRKRANGKKETHNVIMVKRLLKLLADNKLQILNAQGTQSRINFEVCTEASNIQVSGILIQTKF